MPHPTFTPDPAPSPGTRSSPILMLNEAPFGDGYALAQPAGINHVRAVVELAWDALTPAQREALEAFFLERGGWAPFSYQPSGFPAPLTWTCKRWAFTAGAPHTGSATLEQSFAIIE